MWDHVKDPVQVQVGDISFLPSSTVAPIPSPKATRLVSQNLPLVKPVQYCLRSLLHVKCALTSLQGGSAP